MSSGKGVFVSWSKRNSHLIADILNKAIPKILPNIKFFISSNDIEVGDKWRKEIETFLRNNNIMIVILTPENFQSPWIYYEIGMIRGFHKKKATVCPILFNLSHSDLNSNPLNDIQMMEFKKKEFTTLILKLNKVLMLGHNKQEVKKRIKKKWKNITKQINEIPFLDNQKIIITEKPKEVTKLLVESLEMMEEKLNIVSWNRLNDDKINEEYYQNFFEKLNKKLEDGFEHTRIIWNESQLQWLKKKKDDLNKVKTMRIVYYPIKKEFDILPCFIIDKSIVHFGWGLLSLPEVYDNINITIVDKDIANAFLGYFNYLVNNPSNELIKDCNSSIDMDVIERIEGKQ